MKKTYEIRKLIDRINGILLLDLEQSRKEALSILLESVLHETGNYRGFRYTFDRNSLSYDQAEAIKYNRQYN